MHTNLLLSCPFEIHHLASTLPQPLNTALSPTLIKPTPPSLDRVSSPLGLAWPLLGRW